MGRQPRPLGLLIALVLVAGTGFVFSRTALGLRITACGQAPETAEFSGIPVRRLQFRVALVSGAAAGLGGAVQVMAVQHQLVQGISNNYGYTGVVVATLGGLTALGVLLVALLLGDISVGAQNVSLVLQVPTQTRCVLRRTSAADGAVGDEPAALSPGVEATLVNIVALLTAALVIATPLVWAGLGELLVERTGILNLGIEGTMVLGAFVGFVVAHDTGSPILGLAAAAGAGIVAGLLLGVFVRDPRPQPARLRSRSDAAADRGLRVRLPGGVRPGGAATADAPFTVWFDGASVLEQHWLTYVAFLVLAPAAWWVLRSTGFGLRLHAVGESFEAADVAGIHVNRTRYLALGVGSALMAVGGSFLTLAVLGSYTLDIVNGRGWVCIALVIFAQWRVWPVVGGRADLRAHRRAAAAAGHHHHVLGSAARGDARAALPCRHRRARHLGQVGPVPRVVPQGPPSWLSHTDPGRDSCRSPTKSCWR